jgi:hypothetical protein
MKIRAGYEISYDCPQPTPMILTLSVYPSRTPDLLSCDRMLINPAIPVNTYHDSFGNFCHVIRAPVGRLTVSTDFLVQDSGERDVIAPNAEQRPIGMKSDHAKRAVRYNLHVTVGRCGRPVRRSSATKVRVRLDRVAITVAT